MKSLHLLSLLVTITTSAFGQLANDNTFTVRIDGKDYKAQPRRIQLGRYWWVTANTIKPDHPRIWLGSFDHKEIIEPGTYLIVDATIPTPRKIGRKAQALSTYKGDCCCEIR